MRWGNVSEGRIVALEKGVRASKGSGASEWPAGREGELSPIAGLGFLSPPQAAPRRGLVDPCGSRQPGPAQEAPGQWKVAISSILGTSDVVSRPFLRGGTARWAPGTLSVSPPREMTGHAIFRCFSYSKNGPSPGGPGSICLHERRRP